MSEQQDNEKQGPGQSPGLETIILGGGCFWCTESVFLALRGVKQVTPGYAGGHVDNPTYEQVCGKQTGHIEVVRVVYDPAIVSLETILQVFFATHDPTTLDRQGADVGPQYASAVFCQDDGQRETVQRVISQVEHELDEQVVTRVLEDATFWPAEAYHHNFYARNPAQGYCMAVISPKLAKFRQRYAALLSA